MAEGKVRKVWRLYFLVPLPTQPSLQAAAFATQESQTQMCILSSKKSTAAHSPASPEFFPHSHDLWRTEEVSHRKAHCSVAGSVQLLPPEPFCPGLGSQIPRFWARPCLHGSPPRKTQVCQEEVSWFKADTIPSQGQVKSRGFLSPTNFNRALNQWSSVYSSGLEWDSTALLRALGVLVKSCCCRIQIPIPLTTICLLKKESPIGSIYWVHIFTSCVIGATKQLSTTSLWKTAEVACRKKKQDTDQSTKPKAENIKSRISTLGLKCLWQKTSFDPFQEKYEYFLQ